MKKKPELMRALEVLSVLGVTLLLIGTVAEHSFLWWAGLGVVVGAILAANILFRLRGNKQ